MDVKVNWKSRLSFVGTADSGFSVNLGTDPGVGGDDDGLRPMELMALSLAGCTAMDVISILQKKRVDVTDFEVRVHADRAGEHPKVFTCAVVEYLITGHDVDEAAVLRAIELSAEKYCPAQAILAKAFPIELRYEIFEGDQGGKRQLVKEGVYAGHEDVN
ncbi:MAG: OsmC family protein [Chloroflexota bacterium]